MATMRAGTMEPQQIAPYEDPKLLKKLEQNENDYATRLEIGTKIKDRLSWGRFLFFEDYNSCCNKGIEHLSKIPENSQEFLEAQLVLGDMFAGKTGWIPDNGGDLSWNKYEKEDRLKDYNQTLFYFQKIPKRSSFYYEALFSMGLLYYHNKQYGDGIPCFKKIPVKNNNYWNAQYYILLGLFYQAFPNKKSQDLDKMRQQYDRLLKSDKIDKDMMYLMLVLMSPMYLWGEKHSLYASIEKKLQRPCLIFSKNIRRKIRLFFN